MNAGVMHALLAAVAFGASTPFAKLLVGGIAPVTLAALLYLGSGIGLTLWFALRALRSGSPGSDARLQRPDVPWLLGAIFFGGIAGPVLLMFGLSVTPASTASLLLNMEGVLTSLLAWFVFRENFDRRIFVGMLLIIAGGVVLGWEQRPAVGMPVGTVAIVAACLCWAIDNNLTRRISASDAVQIAAIKGVSAGVVNLGIAWSLGLALPEAGPAALAGLVGFCGYGVSLVFFVLALRQLGTARTGAYFSIAPFIGAAVSLLMLGDTPGAGFWSSSMLMGAGIWLHLTERHVHFHAHDPVTHAHEHVHDEHHRHLHEGDWDGCEPHVHAHSHEAQAHSHPHVPDIHHRHRH
nr:EamA family transporter [uncultured Noviherbaspirillum sp.]